MTNATETDPPLRANEIALDPRDPGFVQDPYLAYETFQKFSAVFHWTEYGHICFARHADVSALLRDKRFGRRDPAGDAAVPDHLRDFRRAEQFSLLQLEAPDHTRLRGLVNRAFVSARIEAMRPFITELCDELIDGLKDKKTFDLIPEYATPVPLRAIAELIGAPAEAAPLLREWSARMVARYQFRRDKTVEAAASAAARAFTDFLRDLIRERRASPKEDLISHLAAVHGDSLSQDELISTCILLLNAGHEATVHTIGNGVKALLENKIDAGAVFSSVESTRRTVEEVLRYDPPLHMFTRFALEDLEFNGVKFTKGETIGLLLGAANRDPRIFQRENDFAADRETNPHVSFGGGIHFCIGAPLARLELAIALPKLFARMPGVKIAEIPRYADTYHFHGLESLLLAPR